MTYGYREDTPLREKIYAICTLLLEIALLFFVVAAAMIVLSIFGLLVAHFVMGFPCHGWTHFYDLVLFEVIVATPIMLIGGLLWITLRDEYQRILRRRSRKW
jgi:hypothetical protein